MNKYAFPETYLLNTCISTIIIYSHCYSIVENVKRLPLSLLILFCVRSFTANHNLQKCSFTFKYLKIGSSVLLRDFVQILITKSSHVQSAHFCLFSKIDSCNPRFTGTTIERIHKGLVTLQKF